jgi:hypothetical protein
MIPTRGKVVVLASTAARKNPGYLNWNGVRRKLLQARKILASVPANLALAGNKHERGLGSVTAGGEGMQQGKNASIGQSDTQNDGSGDGKDHHSSGQQTPHVRPTFPSTSNKINGLSPVHPGCAGSGALTLPALTLVAVYL